jgi:hypothetical protein
MNHEISTGLLKGNVHRSRDNETAILTYCQSPKAGLRSVACQTDIGLLPTILLREPQRPCLGCRYLAGYVRKIMHENLL